jgi:hypothetical protein
MLFRREISTPGPKKILKVLAGVIPGFKAKMNTHSMCAQESSFNTYCIENWYKIINVTIYSIYYMNNVL